MALVAWAALVGAEPNRVSGQEVDRYGDIPADSIAIASIDVARMMELPALRYVPWEMAKVGCREQFGFELSDIETVEATVLMPSPMPEFGFSIRLANPFDIEDLNDELVGPMEVAAKDATLRYRDIYEFPMLRIAQKEPGRVLVATEGTMRRMLSQRIQTGGPVVNLVKSSTAPARLVVNTSKLRDLIFAMYEQSEESIPIPLRDDARNMIELVDNVMLEILPEGGSGARFSLGASSEPNAESLLKSMDSLREEGVQLARESLAMQLENEPSMSEDMKQAISGYSDRMQILFAEEAFWSRQGDRVELNMENSMVANYSTIGVLTGLLLPAVQAAREAARRTSSSNNIRQHMLALLNHESAYKRFPDRVSSDDDGQPLLSWRVKILPFLDETELYQEFHLDEPWDSEHNLPLVERMPAVFNNPRQPADGGHTVYLAPYGEEIGWPEGDFRMAQITDGTSNTIAVVEASAKFAVPWTKPEDLDVDLHPGSSWMPLGPGAQVAMFDGSVRFLAASIAEDILRALFTIDGGESVMAP